MLLTLIKHESKVYFKNMTPVYLVVFALAVINRLMFALANGLNVSYDKVAAFIKIESLSVFVLALVVMFVYNITLITSRYKSSITGNEAYLTFSLPVKIHKIIAAKFIVAVLFFIFDIAAGVISSSIIIVFADKMKFLVSFIMSFLSYSSVFILLLILLILFSCQIVTYFLSVVLSESTSHGKPIFTVIYFFAFNIVYILLFLAVCFLCMIFNPPLFADTGEIFLAPAPAVIIFASVNIAVSCICFYVTSHILKKHLNLL